MKKIVAISTFILFALFLSANAQIPEKFQGTWDWTATNAAEGWDHGVTVVTKDSVFVNYTEIGIVIPSEWVTMRSDTLRMMYLLYDTEIVNWQLIPVDGQSRGGYSSPMGEGEFIISKTMDY